MGKLHTLHVRGFKSIRDQALELDSLNVFIGGNGAGKSNLLGVFHLLHRVANQQLQIHTGEAGGANEIMHFGRKHADTVSIRTELHEEPSYVHVYDLALKPTGQDRFIFEREVITVKRRGKPPVRKEWSGHVEAHVADSKAPIAQVKSDLDNSSF